jgi:hypothetical protein
LHKEDWTLAPEANTMSVGDESYTINGMVAYPLPEGTEDAKALNSLLRGEISAAETYDLALNKFEGRNTSQELRNIRDEHHAAMSMLRDRVQAFGGQPVESSGAWGTFASVITGTAMALGMKPVLGALRQGEEHGISEYQKAINADLSAGSRNLIEGELLPRCRKHVALLQQLSAQLV